MRRPAALLAAAAFLAGLGAVVPAAAARSGTAQSTQETGPPLQNGDGLHLVSEKQVDSRLLAITVSTPVLQQPVNVDVLLPTGYAEHPDEHYPVLYLFDGTSGHASDWTNFGDAEQTTAGLPLIVVMPDITYNGDGGGWCTNWVNNGSYGLPEWQTYDIDELIPWVDANFRTIADRDGRAIAGLSQGGFCSMSYAARYPDLFITALSYSGAPDIAYDPTAELGAMAIINLTELGLDGVAPDSMFGDPVTDEINWADHDPTTLANNLRGMNLLMYVGNGLPGPYDGADPVGAGNLIEAAVSYDTALFNDRLVALGIPHLYDPYGNGTHAWPYWARDLRWSIGTIMADFAKPPPPPSSVTYTIADPRYSIYGWQVTMHRAAEEFSTLEHAGSGGFALAGSGSATVVTPADYTPGAKYKVTMSGRSGSQTLVSTADSHGSLSLAVPLGPSNPYQEYSALAVLTGTKVYTTTVSISPDT